MKLSDIPEDDLIAELARRRQRRIRKPLPDKYCHDCRHFVPFFREDREPGPGELCAKGRVAVHIMPDRDDWNGHTGGYHLKNCPDFVVIPPEDEPHCRKYEQTHPAR